MCTCNITAAVLFFTVPFFFFFLSLKAGGEVVRAREELEEAGGQHDQGGTGLGRDSPGAGRPLRPVEPSQGQGLGDH